MKFGMRTPSLKGRVSARLSPKRMVRHNLGLKAPKGIGFLTNPTKATYNAVYNRSSVSIDKVNKSRKTRKKASTAVKAPSVQEKLHEEPIYEIARPPEIDVGRDFAFLVAIALILPWFFGQTAALIITGVVIVFLVTLAFLLPEKRSRVVKAIFASILLSDANRLLQKEKLSESVSRVEQALLEIPDAVALFVDLGAIYSLMGDYRLAIECFEKYPGEIHEPSLLLMMGISYNRLDMYENAKTVLDKLPRELQGQLIVIVLRGLAYLELGHTEVAKAILEKGPLRSRKMDDPDMLPYRYILGMTYKRLGKKKQAATQFSKVYAEDSDYMDVKQQLIDLGKLASSAQESNPISQRTKSSDEDALWEEDLGEGFSFECTFTTGEDPKEMQRYRELQSIWHQASDYREDMRYGMAIRLLDEGMKLAMSPKYDDPDRLFKMKRDLADILVLAGHIDRAVIMMRDIGRLDRIGMTYLKTGRVEEAVSVYKECLSEGMDHVRTNLTKALFASGKQKDALDMLLASNPRLPKKGELYVTRPVYCMIAIYGMEERYGRENLEKDIAKLRKAYPRLIHDIEKRYGNWESALMHFDEASRKGEKDKIIKRIVNPRKSKKTPDMSVNEAEVTTALEMAKLYHKHENDLEQSVELALKGDFQSAKKVITSIRRGKTGLPSNTLRSFYRTFLIAEDKLEDALSWEPEGFIEAGTQGLEFRFNLIYQTNKKLPGSLIAEHFRYHAGKQTAFLKKYKAEFADFCQDRLDEYEKLHGKTLLESLASSSSSSNNPDHGWNRSVGTGNGYKLLSKSPFGKKERPYIYFFHGGEVWQIMGDLLEDAESHIRKKMGLPGIGEGWLSESMMVSELRKRMVPHEVIHQGSPRWLGRQRFDAWIPSLKLAVEYQGEQHYHPIEVFGGEEGFRVVQELDERKAKLSLKNGVSLELVRYDENIVERVRQLADKYIR